MKIMYTDDRIKCEEKKKQYAFSTTGKRSLESEKLSSGRGITCAQNRRPSALKSQIYFNVGSNEAILKKKKKTHKFEHIVHNYRISKITALAV